MYSFLGSYTYIILTIVSTFILFCLLFDVPLHPKIEKTEKKIYMEKIILTGDRPTGKLHLGHYVGSLRRRVELQNAGDFNAQNGTHLVAVAKIHYEPFGIYAGKTASLDELKDGATIAVPNDGTNEARALLLLEAQGLIKLKEGVGLTATKLDIEENPRNFDIQEIEAAQLPRSLGSVDVAVINGNYAIDAGLKASDALAVEDGASEVIQQNYANVLVAKEGNENNEAILALAAALKSDEVKAFIEETYEGAVVPLF